MNTKTGRGQRQMHHSDDKDYVMEPMSCSCNGMYFADLKSSMLGLKCWSTMELLLNVISRSCCLYHGKLNILSYGAP